MVTNVNQTRGDHFAIYRNIKSNCLPQTNIMLYVKNKIQTWESKEMIKVMTEINKIENKYSKKKVCRTKR